MNDINFAPSRKIRALYKKFCERHEGEEGNIAEQFKELVKYNSKGYLRLWTDPYGDVQEEGYGLGYKIHDLDWGYGIQEFKSDSMNIPEDVKSKVEEFGRFYKLPLPKVYQFIYVH